MKKKLLPLLLVSALFLQAGAQTDRMEGELLVRLSAGTSIDQLLAGINTKRTGGRVNPEEVLSRTFNIHLLTFDPTKTNGPRLLEYLLEQPGVLTAQMNYAVAPRELPNDPQFERQWGASIIGAPGVWDVTTGGRSANGDTIVVAILDSGFDVDHEDLKDNIWRNRFEIPGDSIDNDQNGYTDDLDGWNFIDDSGEHPSDLHGTSVAGLVGAAGNNGKGISGINWHVKLMLLSVKTVSQIVSAYDYVIEQRQRYNASRGREGAFVVATNSSIGISRVFCKDQPVWGGMYDLLGEAGILTGAATANNAWDVEEVGDMPTTCTSNFLLTVLNTNDLDQKHSGSAYGNVSIDMGAPGQNSYTTRPSDLYGTFNGTSASAPHLTGAIALLYSLPCTDIAEGAISNPSQTALSIRDILLESVDPVDKLVEFTATGGRLNVLRSMERIQAACGEKGKPLGIVRLYPNPATEWIEVEYNSPDFDPYEFRIFNMIGRLLYRTPVTPVGFSVRKQRLDVSLWPPGIYILEIRRGDTREVARFVVH